MQRRYPTTVMAPTAAAARVKRKACVRIPLFHSRIVRWSRSGDVTIPAPRKTIPFSDDPAIKAMTDTMTKTTSKTPEEWLNEVSPEKPRGIFKLFLGYAPGVGKTYAMLSEAIRRASRGEDVVVGVVESHGRKATAGTGGEARSHPVLRAKLTGTRERSFEELDRGC